MKNLILVMTFMIAPMFAQAAQLTITCTNRAGKTKSVTVEQTRCSAGKYRADGSILNIACRNSDSQVLVARQDNGLSTLVEIQTFFTGRADMPTVDEDYSTPNVICRFR